MVIGEITDGSVMTLMHAGFPAANARYSAGTATQLDLLQAQTDLTTARTNQIQAYYTYTVAVASLRKAMGMADEFVTK